MSNYLKVAFSMLVLATVKVSVLGASWQEIASLGLLTLVVLTLQGVNDKAEREVLWEDVKQIRESMHTMDDLVKKNTSALSTLKINSGITTRRL